MKRIILPSLTLEQGENLINQADDIRDKCIISLFADSGIRLNELLSIKESHIDWESLNMVLRYTRSVKFEESLRLYHSIGT